MEDVIEEAWITALFWQRDCVGVCLWFFSLYFKYLVQIFGICEAEMKTKDKQNLQTRWLNKSVGEAMEGGWETLKNRIEIIQSHFVDFFF